MIAALRQLRRRLWPRVPISVREELTMLRYTSLQAQVPMLYVMLVLLIMVTLYSTPAPGSLFMAFGLPLAIIGTVTARIIIWYRRRDQPVTPAGARRMVNMMTLSSCFVGALASLWGVITWAAAPPADALYYPLLLGMGALSAAFCVSHVRAETVANLIICLFPIGIALIATGDGLDPAAGISILVAGLFMIRLVIQQHGRLVAQLLLERQMRNLAHTDELTGLLNRRALKAEITRLADAGRGMALVLMDLDGFKGVNDQHGHAAGDALLTEVGRRLRYQCGRDVHAARLGGDEFAALLPDGGTAAAKLLADRILLSLVAPVAISGQHIRVGASAGVAEAQAGAVNIYRLFAKADSALYAAKREQRRETAIEDQRIRTA
jgi:diguanylate cyclase